MENKLKMIIGNGHLKLGIKVAKHLNAEIVNVKSGEFDNNELRPTRESDVRNSDLFIFNSLHAHNGQRTIEETEFLTSTCRASANRITGVFPFLGYSKADHQKTYGESVSAKVIADRLSICGLNHILLYDLHKSHIANYFNSFFNLKGVEHFYLMRQLIEYAQNKLKFDTIVGLDDGSYKRNSVIAKYVNCSDIAFVYKFRDPRNLKVVPKHSKVIGDVNGKNVVGFDDMIQSGGTLVTSAKILKQGGAKKVFLLIVHPDFNPKTFNAINPYLKDGTIDKLVVLDTIPIPDRKKWHKNLVILDPSKLIAETIQHLHDGIPMRNLFLPIG